MGVALAHRGPDGEGLFSDGWGFLAHRRLAIIDLARGLQPASNEDGRIQVVFNGEIWNHRTLRHRLESRGHRFRTQADTEVLVHGWEEWGEELPTHLDGMFAFVIYDTVRREVFAARDRLGEKPLFYAQLGGVLHLASEIKALYESPYWTGDLEKGFLEGYLTLGYVMAPSTPYRNVYKLLPGHQLMYRGSDVHTRPYWDIVDFDTDARNEAAVLADVENHVRMAVTERLEAEVPLGALLSGGVDSGVVLSYMTEAMSDTPVTTTVGFPEAGHNELELARRTAESLGSRHFAHTVAPAIDDVFDVIVRAFDEPFADSSAVPTYYVCRAAREHVTVALSGDGGDETFGGYDFRYLPHALEASARAFVPGASGRRAVRALASAWPRSPRLPRALRLSTVLENVAREPADAYYHDLCFMKPMAARRLLGQRTDVAIQASGVYEAVTAPYRKCPSPNVVQKAQYADVKVYLANDILPKVDRMSMATGLEVRCPLLDHQLVELAFRLPNNRKMPHYRGKHLLRQLAAKRLRPEVAQQPKRGFTAPVGAWLAGPLSQAWRSEVLASTSAVLELVDRAELARLFSEHVKGQRDHGYALWALWTYERWARHQAAAVRASERRVLRPIAALA